MRILSIETSCDETAIALLDISGSLDAPEIKMLGNALMSQAHLHAVFGGVYPNLAKREHQKNLPILLSKVLEEARNKIQETNIEDSADYITVTQGPGLEPALWTGITFAEELGRKWNTPVIPVDHMEGHIWSVLYGGQKVALPAMALLVSGGHTELVLVEDFGKYKILGHTLDDAVGEAFDKVARMLDLPYPGGPKISALALISRNKKQETHFKFPRPMINSGDLNFSYSGLKTAVLYKLKEIKKQDEDMKEEIARAFEDAATEVLVSKTRKALELYPAARSLIIAGGVSANSYLRTEMSNTMQEFPDIDTLWPSRDATGDNAIMIGIAGFIRIQTGYMANEKLQAKGNLSLS